MPNADLPKFPCTSAALIQLQTAADTVCPYSGAKKQRQGAVLRGGKAKSWSFGRSSVYILKVSDISEEFGLWMDAKGDQEELRNGMWRVSHCVSLGTPHNFVCGFFARLDSLALPVA